MSGSAFCSRCRKDFNCKDWIQSALVTPENLKNPPEGVAYKESGQGFEVIISTRSYLWIFSLVAVCFYSAFIGFFSWVGLQAQPGMRWTIFLILTPFYLVGAAWWYGALMSICGKVMIQVNGDSGRIFKGIGSLGWSRRFNWRGVEKIRLTKYYMTNRNLEQITLEGDQIIQVARGAKHARLCYMLIALCWNHLK